MKSDPELYGRRMRVARAMLQGVPPMELPDELGMTPEEVARDLKWLRRTWAKEVRRPRLVKLAEVVARVAEIERQAWIEWHRSREALGKSTRTTKDSEKDHVVQQVVGKSEHVGDPRFLTVLLQCIDRRTALQSIKLTPADELPSHEQLTPDQSARLDALLEQLPAETLNTLLESAAVADSLRDQVMAEAS